MTDAYTLWDTSLCKPCCMFTCISRFVLIFIYFIYFLYVPLHSSSFIFFLVCMWTCTRCCSVCLLNVLACTAGIFLNVRWNSKVFCGCLLVLLIRCNFIQNVFSLILNVYVPACGCFVFLRPPSHPCTNRFSCFQMRACTTLHSQPSRLQKYPRGWN